MAYVGHYPYSTAHSNQIDQKSNLLSVMANKSMLWDDGYISAMIDGFDYLSDYEEEEETKEERELRIQRCIEESEREEREEKEALESEERIRVLQKQLKSSLSLKEKDQIKEKIATETQQTITSAIVTTK